MPDTDTGREASTSLPWIKDHETTRSLAGSRSAPKVRNKTPCAFCHVAEVPATAAPVAAVAFRSRNVLSMPVMPLIVSMLSCRQEVLSGTFVLNESVMVVSEQGYGFDCEIVPQTSGSVMQRGRLAVSTGFKSVTLSVSVSDTSH